MSKNIKITDEVATELDGLKRPGQTYDGVVQELLVARRLLVEMSNQSTKKKNG